MKEFKYVITDKGGIHARPAGALVKEAAGKMRQAGWIPRFLPL